MLTGFGDESAMEEGDPEEKWYPVNQGPFSHSTTQPVRGKTAGDRARAGEQTTSRTRKMMSPDDDLRPVAIITAVHVHTRNACSLVPPSGY